MQPRITVITPSYNQGNYIEQTIQSVLSQGYSNLDYMIIDGGSTDETVEIIKKYEHQLSYWVSEKDQGQSDAINKGLQRATGEIFNWLNSDDYLEPGALQAIAEGFAQQPGKKIMCGFTHCFYDETGKESHTYQMGIGKTVAATMMHVEMNQPGSFYRMDAIKELGFLNPSLRYVFDGELWFKFLCKYGLEAVGFTDRLIAHFRLHEASKSVGDGFFEFYKEFLNIHLFLARQLELPAAIIQYLEKDQYIQRYESTRWDDRFLEREELYKHFADKYKFLLYKDRAYTEARTGMKYYLRHFKGNELSAHFLLGLKLLMPDTVIEKIRNTKTQAVK